MAEKNSISSPNPIKKESLHQHLDAEELGIQTSDSLNNSMKHNQVKFSKPRKSKKWKLFLGGFIVMILIVFAWVAAGLVGAGYKILSKNYSGGSPFLNFFGKPTPTQLKGEGDGRINILLLGMGGPGHDGPELTDTIMVLSIDPVDNEAAMLSIPRDLYVKVSDHGYSKINGVYSIGQQDKRSAEIATKSKKKNKITQSSEVKDGPTLIKETISNLLDLPIHYSVTLDFEGFRKIIDEIDGVDVYVGKDIIDTRYPTKKYGYTTFKITKGDHHLDGETALKYARSRESTSDFDRAKRQQQIIQEVKEKTTSLEILANPKKIWDFSQILGDHLRMDFQLEEIKRLIEIGKAVPKDKIFTTVLDTSSSGPLIADNIGDQFILRPKDKSYKEIQRIAHEIFTDPYLRQEKADIEIQNASGKSGLGTRVAKTLKSYNYNITSIKTATKKADTTQIIDYTGGRKPFTIEFLKKRIKGEVSNSISTKSKADIVIILGTDYKVDSEE